MDRRKLLKVAGLAAVTAAVGVQASTTEEPYMNRIEMKPENPSKMSQGELKHSPEITIKEKDAKGYTRVEIKVGQGGIIHPSTSGHWIDFISLYADNKLVGKSLLEAEISRGIASFALKLDNVKTLKSQAGCNLHGICTTTITL